MNGAFYDTALMSSQNLVQLLRQIESNQLGFFSKVQTVGEIMSPQYERLTLDDSLGQAVSAYERSHCASIAIFDPDKGDVVGVLTDRDILRNTPRNVGTLLADEEDETPLKTNVSLLMRRKPPHVSPKAPLPEAIRLMLEHSLDAILVYDDPTNVVGMLSTEDFLNTLLLYYRICSAANLPMMRLRLIDFDSGLSIDEVVRRGAYTVRDVMSYRLESLRDTASVAEVIRLMESKGIRHVPILDAQNRFAGLVSDREILRALRPPRQATNPSAGPSPSHDRRVALAADERDPLLREKASHVMVAETPTIAPPKLFVEALTLLKEHQGDCLPVIDDSGKLCGIVTSTDVLRLFRIVIRFGNFDAALTSEAVK